MEHFANNSRRLSAKRSILDIGQGFEYASIYGIDIICFMFLCDRALRHERIKVLFSLFCEEYFNF